MRVRVRLTRSGTVLPVPDVSDEPRVVPRRGIRGRRTRRRGRRRRGGIAVRLDSGTAPSVGVASLASGTLGVRTSRTRSAAVRVRGRPRNAAIVEIVGARARPLLAAVAAIRAVEASPSVLAAAVARRAGGASCLGAALLRGCEGERREGQRDERRPHSLYFLLIDRSRMSLWEIVDPVESILFDDALHHATIHVAWCAVCS